MGRNIFEVKFSLLEIMPKKEFQRGLSQEDRRRRSANRPIGGGGTPQQANSRKKDEGYGNTRLQRISGIIGIVMLVALLLSLIPACYYSNAGAAELPAGYAGYGRIPAASHLTLTSRPDAAPAVHAPVAISLTPGRFSPDTTGSFATLPFFKRWLERGGAELFGLPSRE